MSILLTNVVQMSVSETSPWSLLIQDSNFSRVPAVTTITRLHPEGSRKETKTITERKEGHTHQQGRHKIVIVCR